MQFLISIKKEKREPEKSDSLFLSETPVKEVLCREKPFARAAASGSLISQCPQKLPSSLRLGFGLRFWVVRSTATRPNVME